MPTPRRHLLIIIAAPLALGLAITALGAGPAAARSSGHAEHPWPGHPGRHLVMHTAQAGDTATGLAVRFHAWTAELIQLNHLGPRAVIRVGQRLRIPAVDAAHRDHRTRPHHHSHHAHHHKGHAHHPRNRHHHKKHARHHHERHHSQTQHQRRMHRHGWRHYRMNRAQVRHTVTRTAHRHHISSNLALAIAWQESGWRQPLVSSAGAIGVMQLLPSTGQWMSQYAGRHLNIRNTYDNVRGGVALIRVLRKHTSNDKNAVAAYYQGLGALHHYGWYESTVGYVRSVRAIRHHLSRTGSPTG